ncbi:hypothetical protein CspeluHIS016_0505800 [Cutaneotrichosporon spelunceum]|uniref:Urea carboxylase n=1 Tax=Cutaneotrichosporon spelunceum TaxID=1672016 RepID=A0AAD3TXH0_9TREE|nr:hypothetical protein CspeluHIS016_0505800 [Cutaneotrichosporon spelunceum]
MTVQQKILIANRGEIALRIQRSADKLGVPTVAIYTLADAATPHVTAAGESYMIGDGTDHRGYLDMEAIINIAKKSGTTMIAPGYGFLSENTTFARMVEDAGIIFLGPTPTQISSMGLKHEAREVAKKAGVPIVPGSEGVVDQLEDAVTIAAKIGYPVIVKASGGGGGMGMTVCRDESEMRANFEATREKGAVLFKESAVFVEKYIERARHIEVQVFGNGQGHVIHAGERECSVQRRHQKIIEEAPCALFASAKGQEVRKAICKAAVDLCKVMNYRSAGTVEFVLDDLSPNLDFYFLELNARIQVEHPVTEVIHPGLDLVELMIRQGMQPTGSLPAAELQQEPLLEIDGHAIEVRVYCENPNADFQPSPGQLFEVQWGDVGPRGRIETWVRSGSLVTPYYDPMVAKLIVWGPTRQEAIDKAIKCLDETKVIGPHNNIAYCRAILDTKDFRESTITTTWCSRFKWRPNAVEVLTPGISTTVQDLPGRRVGLGLPRGGPGDMLSFQAANLLAGNDRYTEALECTVQGPKLRFHVDSVVAVAGADMKVTINGKEAPQWTTLFIKAGETLSVGMVAGGLGLRSYIAVRGGFGNVSEFMGSKSTFTGASLGGYQGRTLLPGDLLEIPASSDGPTLTVPPPARVPLTNEWTVPVLTNAQWDLEYLDKEGMETLLGATWTVSTSSSRSGLRLEGPRIKWSRPDGGEGGAHPSNVLDQGYAFGSLNVNGDTPVLFAVDSPDMGGFSNVLSMAVGSAWKSGQMRPQDKIRFVLVSPAEAEQINKDNDAWLAACTTPKAAPLRELTASKDIKDITRSSVLHHVPETKDTPGRWIRQCGDEYLIYEVGRMELTIQDRVRVELWERAMKEAKIPGVVYMNACVRSSIVHFDPRKISPGDLVKRMADIDAGLPAGADVELDVTIHKFPCVPDDKWTHESIDYYMKTTRKEAVYLPSNTQYIADNNGMTLQDVHETLTCTPWLVLAHGFFVMLPFIIPMDPTRRVLGQKYNPSRTKTCEGAIGLAGVIGAIYPIASAGGYQLLGRTLSTWQAWAEKHSILDNFDSIEFYTVTEDEFVDIERQFKAGSWKPETRASKFKMVDYTKFITEKEAATAEFKKRQKECSTRVAAKEEEMFKSWLAEKEAEAAAGKGAASTAEAEGEAVISPLSASVWKVLVKEGDVIESAEQHVVELEAMKTSVFIAAGDDMEGKTVGAIVVADGDAVSPGAPLLYLK